MAATRVELPDVLDISRVSGVKADLLVTLARDTDLVLVGEGVQRVDAAGVQLLAALCAEVERRGHAWSWDGISNELRAATRHLGLDRRLGVGGDEA